MRPNARSASATAASISRAARDVHLQRQGAAPERADRLRRAAVRARVAVAERDVGARLRQRDRAGAPEARAPRPVTRAILSRTSKRRRVGWLHDGKNDTTRGVSDCETSLALDALAARFAAAAIPATEWTHQTHLTVGAWHVARFGPDAALERLRAGIRRAQRRARHDRFRHARLPRDDHARLRPPARRVPARAAPPTRSWTPASRRCSPARSPRATSSPATTRRRCCSRSRRAAAGSSPISSRCPSARISRDAGTSCTYALRRRRCTSSCP